MDKNCVEVLKGNTDTLSLEDDGKKCKSWCFTSFEIEKPVFFAEKFRYLCFSPEICPTTKKNHYQGYFYLNNDMTLSAIKKKINGKWKLIKCNGTPQQNKIYCGSEDYIKDGKVKLKNPLFEEFGTIPKQGQRVDLIEINEKIKKGASVKEMRQEDPLLYHMYGRTLEKLEDDYLRTQYRKDMPQVIWYYGKTGTGKSHTAFKNYNRDTDYLLNVKDGGFWEGYLGQKTVIINEFRGQIPFEDLLQICDKWDYMCKRKGRETIPLLANKIIITSCKRPEDIYKHSLDDEDCIDQFTRRCEIIELKASAFTL